MESTASFYRSSIIDPPSDDVTLSPEDSSYAISSILTSPQCTYLDDDDSTYPDSPHYSISSPIPDSSVHVVTSITSVDDTSLMQSSSVSFVDSAIVLSSSSMSTAQPINSIDLSPINPIDVMINTASEYISSGPMSISSTNSNYDIPDVVMPDSSSSSVDGDGVLFAKKSKTGVGSDVDHGSSLLVQEELSTDDAPSGAFVHSSTSDSQLDASYNSSSNNDSISSHIVNNYKMNDFLASPYYDSTNGIFTDPSGGGGSYNLAEAVNSSLINGSSALVYSTLSCRYVFLNAACKCKIIDNSYIWDTLAEVRLTLKEALFRQILLPVTFPLSMKVFLRSPFYVDHCFREPSTGKHIPVSEAIALDWLDMTAVYVYTDSAYLFVDAVLSGVADLEEDRLVVNHRSLPLCEAFQRGILLDIKHGLTLWDLIMLGWYDVKSGGFTVPYSNSGTTDWQTLKELINQHYISTENSLVLDQGNNDTVDLLTAIQRGFVDPNFGVYLDTNGCSLPLDRAVGLNLILPPRSFLRFTEAFEKGLCTPRGSDVSDSWINFQANIAAALDDYVLDVTSTVVWDGLNSHAYLSVAEARTAKIVDFHQGSIRINDVDDPTSLFYAVEQGLVFDVAFPKDFSYLLSNKLAFDVSGVTYWYSVPLGKYVDFPDALSLGVLDTSLVSFRLPHQSNYRSFREYVAKGYFEVETGNIRLNPRNIEREPVEVLSFRKAWLAGFVKRRLNNPMSLSAIILRGYYESSQGLVTDPLCGDKLSLHTACRSGCIDGDILSTFYPDRQTLVSLKVAFAKGLVDRSRGTYRTSKGKLDLCKAMDDGYIYCDSGDLSLFSAIRMGLWNNKQREFLNPLTGQRYSLSQAMRCGFINPNSSYVKNILSRTTFIPVPTAIQLNILDPHKAWFIEEANDSTYSLKHAFDKNWMIPSATKLSLRTLREYGCISSKLDGHMITDPLTGNRVNLSNAITYGLVDASRLHYCDKKLKVLLPYELAVVQGLITPDSGHVVDLSTWTRMSISLAERTSVLVDRQIPTFQSLASTDCLDFFSGMFYDEATGAFFPLKSAILNDVIDCTDVYVWDFELKEHHLIKKAVADGLIQFETQSFISSAGTLHPLIISYDTNGIMICNKPLLSLVDLISGGYLDFKTGMINEPTTGHTFSLTNGILSNRIQSNSMLYRDYESGTILTLFEALELGYLTNTTVFDSRSRIHIPIWQAVTTGDVFVVPGRPVDVVDALELGLFNPRARTFLNPHVLDEELSLNEALKRRLIDISSTCVKYPGSGISYRMKDAISGGYLDRVSGDVLHLSTGERIRMNEAMEKGLIIRAGLKVDPKYGASRLVHANSLGGFCFS